MAKKTSKSRAAPAERGFVDRIQPALKLSELHKTSEAVEASSAQQKVRANLQLPPLEQTTEAAAIVPKGLAALARAREIATDTASRIPALVEHGSALPSARTEPPSDSEASVAITSVHDLGQLIREAREQRKLSQQTFADLAGVGRRFISELENGKATLEFDKVLQVASATGIDLLARRRQ